MDSQLYKNKFGLIVCADDFGASAGVNDAIIRLLKNERISAVSCLVAGRAWEQGARALKKYQGVVDMGLHLFYEDMPFHQILSLAYTKRLDQRSILGKFKLQLDSFRESMGSFPDFIDGHQHIHQLPVFRSALMDLIDTAKLSRVYVRNSAMGLNDIVMRKTSLLKNIIISLPGATLKKDLSFKNIPTNNDFLGIYNFNKAHNPEDNFESFLRSVNKPNSILMSHPSCGEILLNAAPNASDKNRIEELRYLESNKYKETMESCGLYLTRFKYASEK